MVIKVRAHEKMSSSLQLMIEGYFYHHYPKLRRVPLRKFEKASKLCRFFNKDEKQFLELAADSRKIYGVLLPCGTLIIHPDGVFKEIGKIGQAYIKKLSVVPRNLQRMLRNRQIN